jgi:hypothetical protein
MNLKLTDPKADKVAENLVAALKSAKDQGKPFVIEWRQSDAQAQHWQDESGAGCTCGGSTID